MCDVSMVMMAVMAVSAIAAGVSQRKAAKKNAAAVHEANQVRAEQISDATSAELNERARAARRAKASARAAASQSGINLASGSFLGEINSIEADFDMASGVISKNGVNAQKARQADYKTALSGIQWKTNLGIGLDAAQAGVQGYVAGGGKSYLGKQPGKG